MAANIVSIEVAIEYGVAIGIAVCISIEVVEDAVSAAYRRVGYGADDVGVAGAVGTLLEDRDGVCVQCLVIANYIVVVGIVVANGVTMWCQ